MPSGHQVDRKDLVWAAILEVKAGVIAAHHHHHRALFWALCTLEVYRSKNLNSGVNLELVNSL